MTPTEKTTHTAGTTQREIAYWMGQVDSKLEGLSEKIDSIVKRLENVETRQNQDDTKKPEPPKNGSNGNGNGVTKTWLLEKFFIPLMMGFAFWFLFTVLPDLLKIN